MWARFSSGTFNTSNCWEWSCDRGVRIAGVSNPSCTHTLVIYQYSLPLVLGSVSLDLNFLDSLSSVLSVHNVAEVSAHPGREFIAVSSATPLSALVSRGVNMTGSSLSQ